MTPATPPVVPLTVESTAFAVLVWGSILLVLMTALYVSVVTLAEK
ncbi:hypothetical protein [Haladaptatus sp. CMAA 1911]